MEYTMQEAADLLGVDQRTLRKWLRDLELQPVPDHFDQRRKLLSDQQVRVIAQRHRRFIQTPDELRVMVSALQQQVSALTQTVTFLQSQLVKQ